MNTSGKKRRRPSRVERELELALLLLALPPERRRMEIERMEAEDRRRQRWANVVGLFSLVTGIVSGAISLVQTGQQITHITTVVAIGSFAVTIAALAFKFAVFTALPLMLKGALGTLGGLIAKKGWDRYVEKPKEPKTGNE